MPRCVRYRCAAERNGVDQVCWIANIAIDDAEDGIRNGREDGVTYRRYNQYPSIIMRYPDYPAGCCIPFRARPTSASDDNLHTNLGLADFHAHDATPQPTGNYPSLTALDADSCPRVTGQQTAYGTGIRLIIHGGLMTNPSHGNLQTKQCVRTTSASGSQMKRLGSMPTSATNTSSRRGTSQRCSKLGRGFCRAPSAADLRPHHFCTERSALPSPISFQDVKTLPSKAKRNIRNRRGKRHQIPGTYIEAKWR